MPFSAAIASREIIVGLHDLMAKRSSPQGKLDHVVDLIGAASPNPDANDDGFKLKAITVTSAVPEPATWAMMLVGFGLAGASLRRRNRRPVPAVA